MRIALFTPLTPVRTALSDIIEGLLPHLVRELDITVVTNGTYTPTHPMFQPGGDPFIPWITYDKFQAQAEDFDLIVYNLGDEPRIHGYMFYALYRYPGLVLLHDLVLHHAIAGITWAEGKGDAYIDELRYSYGDEAERLAHEVMSGNYEAIFVQYPLVERVLDSSLGVVVFNGFMVREVLARCPDLPVLRSPLPFYLPEEFPPDFDVAAFRRAHDLADRPVLATFGLFNTQKRLNLALRAFQRLLIRHPDAVYLLVGASIDPELDAKLNKEGLAGKVRETGWQPRGAFTQYLTAVDVAVHLRYPHVGGTPYTPIRLLGLGTPTIISDIEPLAEIPANVVVRITPEVPDEEGMLFAAMDYLLTHPEVRRALGESARRFIIENHSADIVAAQWTGFFREVAARREMLTAQVKARAQAHRFGQRKGHSLERAAGQALAELGVTPGQRQVLLPVAQAIHELTGSLPGRGRR